MLADAHAGTTAAAAVSAAGLDALLLKKYVRLLQNALIAALKPFNGLFQASSEDEICGPPSLAL